MRGSWWNQFPKATASFFPPVFAEASTDLMRFEWGCKKGEAKQQSLHKQKVESPQMAGH